MLPSEGPLVPGLQETETCRDEAELTHEVMLKQILNGRPPVPTRYARLLFINVTR